MPSGVYERKPEERERLRQMVKNFGNTAALEANRNWAGDPCSVCGKYPLSVHNKCGMCRECRRKARI